MDKKDKVAQYAVWYYLTLAGTALHWIAQVQ